MALPAVGPRVPRRGGPIRAAAGAALLRLLGWRLGGAPPDLAKCVIIAAPHSSNWDFIIGIAVVFAFRLDIRFVGKAELFRGPLGPVMRWLGGLPVDRLKPEGFVAQIVAQFRERDQLLLAMAPEGTRQPVASWKTGFYRIARGAGVPIVAGYFDNGKREVGFGPVFVPTGDLESDLAEIRRFYAGKQRRKDGTTEGRKL